MPAVITGRWTGLDQAVRNAALLGKEIGNQEVLEKALVEIGKPLRDDIAHDCPRSPDAPHVAETFVVVPSKEARASGEAVVRVGPKNAKGSVGFVAAFLEFGTSKMSPRPFIRPNYDRFKGGYARAAAAAIQKHFERVVRKYTNRAAKGAGR